MCPKQKRVVPFTLRTFKLILKALNKLFNSTTKNCPSMQAIGNGISATITLPKNSQSEYKPVHNTTMRAMDNF